jgi:hypothetical protein
MPRTDGRTPAPLEVRRRRGRGNGKDSAGRPLPQPLVIMPGAVDVPDPPAGLLLPGRELWAQVWRAGAVWLAPTDLPALEAVCALADDLAVARDKYRAARLAADGQMVAKLHLALMQGLASLGLDTASRGRLGLAEVKKQSELEALLTRRAGRG